MKHLFFGNSTLSASGSLAMLILRLSFGLSMLLGHGWQKITEFSTRVGSFPDPMRIGSRGSLILVIFAETVCAFLVTIGLLTRAATIPLIITMAVAASVVSKDRFALVGNVNELAILFLSAFVALFIMGPGKYSVDNLFM